RCMQLTTIPGRDCGSKMATGSSSEQSAANVMLKTLCLSILCLSAATLRGTDSIVFTDSQAAVLRADAVTGGHSVISQQNKLMQPFGIAIGKNGEFYVSDTGCLGLLRIDPLNGDQTLIASAATLGVPFGIAVERSGMILVANGQTLLRVNPATGVATVAVSQPNVFRVPLAVTVAENGDIYVVDALGAVVHVDPVSGAQSLVTSGGYLERPQGIAVRGNKAYVTDVGTSDMNFGSGRIIQIDLRTTEQ